MCSSTTEKNLWQKTVALNDLLEKKTMQWVKPTDDEYREEHVPSATINGTKEHDESIGQSQCRSKACNGPNRECIERVSSGPPTQRHDNPGMSRAHCAPDRSLVVRPRIISPGPVHVVFHFGHAPNEPIRADIHVEVRHGALEHV